MATVTVSVDTSTLTRLISEVSAGLDRAAPRIVSHMESSVQATFDSEGAAGGNPPWKDTTLTAFANRVTERDKGEGPGGELFRRYRARSTWKTLVDTGKLRRSWKGSSAKRKDGVTVTVQPGVPYGAQVHAGGPVVIDGRAGTLPPRMVFLRNADPATIEDIVAEEVLRG